MIEGLNYSGVELVFSAIVLVLLIFVWLTVDIDINIKVNVKFNAIVNTCTLRNIGGVLYLIVLWLALIGAVVVEICLIFGGVYILYQIKEVLCFAIVKWLEKLEVDSKIRNNL